MTQVTTLFNRSVHHSARLASMLTLGAGLTFGPPAGAQTAAPATQPATAPADDLLARMSGAVNVNFDGVRLETGLTFFSEIQDLAVEVDWPRLEALELTPDTEVTFKAADLTWARALALTIDQASAGLAVAYVHQGTVRVTTREHFDLLGEVRGPAVRSVDLWTQSLPRAVQKDHRQTQRPHHRQSGPHHPC